jgi:hypothetical protein
MFGLSRPHGRPVVEAISDRSRKLVVIDRPATLSGKHALEKESRADIHVQYSVAEVGIAVLGQ